MAIPQVRGKLLRPLTAFSFVDRRRREALDDRFWLGCLAVQMAHEASLHHDDVLDSGFGRRNASTLLARRGPGAALLAGDLYLTGSYRVAQMTGSEGFLAEFVVAVEATVRGERMQGEIGAADDPGGGVRGGGSREERRPLRCGGGVARLDRRGRAVRWSSTRTG